MEFKVHQYLKQRGQFEKPLLVGFSGGPDSLALAQVLLQLGISFHLAHFDHGWREESAKECSELKLWAQERDIPFFTERAKVPDLTENGAREQRLAFFKKLYSQGTYEALVLAHHRQDLAETTLKRMLEGGQTGNTRIFANTRASAPFRQKQRRPQVLARPNAKFHFSSAGKRIWQGN
jgi:tRNA(Ile)-lysidine synthase